MYSSSCRYKLFVLFYIFPKNMVKRKIYIDVLGNKNKNSISYSQVYKSKNKKRG